jgi:4'-phosphopantetheinyl transferase
MPVSVDPVSLPPLTRNEVHVWQWPWTRDLGNQPPTRWLAAYAGVPVGELVVLRGVHGKPYLGAPHDDITFSWSHSGDRALLAVARDLGQLGVDIERSRTRPRLLELARRFYAPEEADALEALPASGHLAAFLALWTAKEAVLKAHGGGLSYGLHRARFALANPVRAVAFDGEIAPASDWQLHDIAQGEDWHAAVAWRGEPREVRLFTAPPPFTSPSEPFA